MIEAMITDLLLNPIFVVIMGIAFIALGVILFIKQKSMSKQSKWLLGICLVICLIYFIFLAWCVIGFGSNLPDADPTPITK